MEDKFQKQENSLEISIPNNILKSSNIKLDDNKIVIVPLKKKISLEKRFKEYNGENLAKDFSWDGRLGKEIW